MTRRLIVGLGNPGPRYASNRHNVGFMVVDEVASAAGIPVSREKFKGLYGNGTVEGTSVVLLKPQTFMNLSGQSVSPTRNYFNIELDELLVVYDELDLPYGRIRLKASGGHGGHNGMRSIIAQLGGRNFARLRVGIGRPQRGSVSDHVLSDFAVKDEREALPSVIDEAARAVRAWVTHGVQKAMNQVNAPS